MNSKDRLKAAVVAWLRGISSVDKDIDDDLDLFESGLLTSLTFVRLLLVIEDVIGEEVVADAELVDKVRTVAAICENFSMEEVA